MMVFYISVASVDLVKLSVCSLAASEKQESLYHHSLAEHGIELSPKSKPHLICSRPGEVA